MANTYTSNWIRVSHGDITTHNPQELVGTSTEINITDAEIQCEGITKEVDETLFSSPASKPLVNTTFKNTSFTFTVPDVPKNATSHRFTFSIPLISNNKISGELKLKNNSTGELYRQESFTSFENIYGNQEVYDDYGADPDNIPLNTEIEWEVTLDSEITTTTNTGNFTNGNEPDNHLTFYTVGYYPVYDTKNPRVTRDVIGELGDVTLTDGSQTVWKTLNGLEPSGNQEFYHDIDGSEEAYFRFRFDWEPAYPTALKQMRLQDMNSDITHKVALADPSDSQLQYNCFRTAIYGTTYAIDVVDPSDSSAIETHRMYHPTDGIVCPRSYDTVT